MRNIRKTKMSVPKWRRDSHENGKKKGWQDATTAAEKLFKHTLQKTGGPGGRKYFSKSDTFSRKLPLLKTSRKVFRLCKRANLAYPIKPRHFKFRRKTLVKAYCAVDDMFTYLTAFNEDKRIEGLEYWTGLVNDVANLLTAWMKSDEERLRKMKEERIRLKCSLKQEMEALRTLPFGNRRITDKTARNQWLRSPYVGYAHYQRYVYASTGVLTSVYPYYAHGVAPDCIKSQTE